MAALDFPDNPATGDLYGSSGTVWRWDGARWASTAGASGARGQTGYAQVVVSQGGITTVVDITGLSLSLGLVAGRRYKVTAHAYASSNVSQDQVSLQLRDGLNSILQTHLVMMPAANVVQKFHVEYVFTAVNTGTQVLKVSMARVAGTGTVMLYGDPITPAFILVEDITYEAGSSGVGIEPTAWVNLTLQNSWVAFSAAETPAVSRMGDMVRVRGHIKSGASGSVPFTLPEGFRPLGGPFNYPLAAFTTVPVTALIVVFPAGGCTLYTSSTSDTSVNFSFPISV